MKKLTTLLATVIILTLFSCGFNAKSDSSVKSRLCSDTWTSKGNIQGFEFKKDGSFRFWSNNDNYNGTYQLGEYYELGNSIFVRKINLDFQTEGVVTQGFGKHFTIELGEGSNLSTFFTTPSGNMFYLN